MNNSQILDANTTSLRISNSRVLNFSIDKVYSMFSNPEYLKQWYWPKWFTNTFEKFDFSENWEWDFTMHWPDGMNYPNKCQFLKIIENELLIWEHLSVPNFQINVRLTKIDANTTKFDFIMLFYEKNIHETVSQFAPEKNEENIDKLVDLLEKVYKK